MSQATAAAPASTFPPAIADGVREALKCFFSATMGDVPTEMPQQTPENSCSGVVGVISLFGDIPWTFAIALPETTAVQVTNKFCGFEIPFDSPDMGDVVGELANVLGGEISAKLDARRIKAQLSLPMVARGTNVEVLMPIGLPSLILGFRCAHGPFWVKMAAARPGQMPGRRPGT